MVKEKGPQKEKIRTGDPVMFKADAPDALFPPFDRTRVYTAGIIRGNIVELAESGTLLPVSVDHLEKVGSEHGRVH